jgi:hypothetical protein
MSVPDDGDYSEFRSDQIAVVIAGLDPAIRLFRKKMDARVKPGSSPRTRMTRRGLQEVSNVKLLEALLRD